MESVTVFNGRGLMNTRVKFYLAFMIGVILSFWIDPNKEPAWFGLLYSPFLFFIFVWGKRQELGITDVV